ncbi:MAG: hypothetical protein HY899_15350 [Deltaproteobacteria bacterium]|nr:hypothetical protein [Deltaproteobacteria bacterium]
MRAIFWALVAIAAFAFTTAAVAATADHLECYKIKDGSRIAGSVDLTSAQFGYQPGCRVAKGMQFCVPVSKNVTGLTVNGQTATPLPVYGPPVTDDRICYKIVCPKLLVPIADQIVTDQFDSRTISRFKASMMCTPAIKSDTYCGDGVISPGEDCDGAALGSCTVGCQSDCTCTCETACCYMENTAAPPDTECFEYQGTPSQVTWFINSCNPGGMPPAPGSLPAAATLNSAVLGPCQAGPMFGFSCIAGGPGAGNLHVMPAESTCP